MKSKRKKLPKKSRLINIGKKSDVVNLEKSLYGMEGDGSKKKKLAGEHATWMDRGLGPKGIKKSDFPWNKRTNEGYFPKFTPHKRKAYISIPGSCILPRNTVFDCDVTYYSNEIPNGMTAKNISLGRTNDKDENFVFKINNLKAERLDFNCIYYDYAQRGRVTDYRKVLFEGECYIKEIDIYISKTIYAIDKTYRLIHEAYVPYLIKFINNKTLDFKSIGITDNYGNKKVFTKEEFVEKFSNYYTKYLEDSSS